MKCSDIIFKCQKCGHCCEGKGGIVVSESDIDRLADFLGITADNFINKYIYISNNKRKIINDDRGKCIFFNSGCNVHPAKPDICRAWPFFRGNLEDPASLEMAKEFCPGINKECNPAEFKSYGLKELTQNNLIKSDPAANALRIGHLLQNKNHQAN